MRKRPILVIGYNVGQALHPSFSGKRVDWKLETQLDGFGQTSGTCRILDNFAELSVFQVRSRAKKFAQSTEKSQNRSGCGIIQKERPGRPRQNESSHGIVVGLQSVFWGSISKEYAHE
jgi:hypothetical protein